MYEVAPAFQQPTEVDGPIRTFATAAPTAPIRRPPVPELINLEHENDPSSVGPLYDMQRRVLGLTKVGWLNLLVLQWLGMRLAANCDLTDRGHVIVGWSVRPTWPLAHWRADYRIAGAAWAALVAIAVVLL